MEFFAVLINHVSKWNSSVSRWGLRLQLTLSATIGPLVARVSAAITTPPSKRQPTIVVPVDVAFGRGTPCAWRARFRLWLEKSKPGILRLS